MSEYTCYLFTVYYPHNSYVPLLRCAVKIKTADILESADMDPMASSEYFAQFLPEHVRSCGPIVAIERIFEIATPQPSIP